VRHGAARCGTVRHGGPPGAAQGIRNSHFWNPATCAGEFGRRMMRACSACVFLGGSVIASFLIQGGIEKATKNEQTFEEKCFTLQRQKH
jgi:hypothetical protein